MIDRPNFEQARMGRLLLLCIGKREEEGGERERGTKNFC